MSTSYDRSAINDFVHREFREMGVEEDRLTPDATLDELGLDSLDVVELSQAASKKLGITIGQDDFAETKTLEEAVGVVYACSQR